jgi:pSer/pThr/pTyr-binding forkhead associated (FHA) protein
MKNYAMRFISGKYQGGEFPLPPNAEIVVGRSSDLDMVLVEDMVSRRHAKITVNGDAVTIQDLGSTNGTFVNGERIERMTLTDGDRVLIGTSIIKLVTTDGPVQQAIPKKRLEEVAAGRRTNQVRSMSGAIDEVPLPDLLQLFGSSRKTGVLVIKTDTDVGKVYLERGSIVFASINDSELLGPEKSVHRILAWRHGTFYMEPLENLDLPTRIELSTEAALMEGMRILDEVDRFELPPMRSSVRMISPLGPKLRDLNADQLEVFQVAIAQTQLEAVFNNCGLPDLEIAASLSVLFKRGYLEAIPLPPEEG